MSTNSECMFVEVEPGEWYYALEHYDAPQNSWDWLEHATAYGPFPTFEVAYQHLGDNHANPGGFGKSEYDPKHTVSPTMQKLIDEAKKEPKPYYNRPHYRR